MKPPLGLLALGTMCLTTSLLAACAYSPMPSPSPLQVATPGPNDGWELPAPLYFLREGQIWRLARDGQTQQPITREAAPVESFDVSPLDGALVYVTNNTLIRSDALGENRQVLLSGPALPPVEDELAALNDRDYITGKIATPVWSPDGGRIAYVQNGLNLMVVSSGEMQTAHPNDDIPEQGEVTDRLAIASVISWSPDGQHLLVMAYRYPLRSIYDQQVTLKTLSGYLSAFADYSASTFAWSADSQTLYLGNPSMGGQAALSRCAVADRQCTWIGQDVPARTAYFYAYPYVPNSDELYVFMATSPSPDEAPGAFKLYRLQPDGYGMTVLRQDEHSLQTALWAADGSAVLVVTASASEAIAVDTLVWLPVDGSAAVSLPVTGPQTLRWGVDR